MRRNGRSDKSSGWLAIVLGCCLLVGCVIVVMVWDKRYERAQASADVQRDGGVRPAVVHKPRLSIDDTSSDEAKALLAAARQQIGVVTTYDFDNGYYGSGGFPPLDTGVCTDVIWRAYRDIDKDFKHDIIQHHARYPSLYTNFGDTNISFRRVKNIDVFLRETAQSLTTEMIPWDRDNLAQWQAGDIVIFGPNPPKNLWHIGIIADERRDDGVPYMIDNHGNGVAIRITPLSWPTAVVGHYRPL